MADSKIIDVHAEKLATSLKQLSSYLRAVAEDADAYAKVVVNGKAINGAHDSSDDDLPTKSRGRKRKSPNDDEADGKRKKRAKKEKDPNAPKRPATSYILYQNDCRALMKEQNPGLHNTDLLRHISDTWKALPEKEKAAYEAKAAQLKDVYAETVKEYNVANNIQPVEKKGIKKPAVAAPAPVAVVKPSESSVGDSEEEASESEADEPPARPPPSKVSKISAKSAPAAKPASKAKPRAPSPAMSEDSTDADDEPQPPPKKATAKKAKQPSPEMSEDSTDADDEPQPPPPKKGAKRTTK